MLTMHQEAVSKKAGNREGTRLALASDPGSPLRLTAVDPINGPPAPVLHFTALIQATGKFGQDQPINHRTGAGGETVVCKREKGGSKCRIAGGRGSGASRVHYEVT